MHDTLVQPTPARHKKSRTESGGPVEDGAERMELGQLLHEVYSDLKKLARRRTRRLPRWWSLRTTGLVHEALERLQRRDRVAWPTRSHFFADVAQAMHDIAVEYVRSKQAKRRGGHMVRTGRVSLIGDGGGARAASGDKLAVFEALERLRAEHPRIAEIVFLRFFCDMTTVEIASWLGVTTRTVERKWSFARTWLQTELALH